MLVNHKKDYFSLFNVESFHITKLGYQLNILSQNIYLRSMSKYYMSNLDMSLFKLPVGFVVSERISQ